MGLKKKFGIAALAALFSVSSAGAYAATLTDISKQLVCQCGCNQILNSCNHSTCMVRELMNTTISNQLSAGKSEADIVQFFVAQYGEQVLAAPPKRGFNLMAWLSPFAALLAGGGVVYFAIRRWVRRGEQPPVTVKAEIEDGEDEEYQRQLDHELEEFVGSGFR